jgi:hypothetical protein
VPIVKTNQMQQIRKYKALEAKYLSLRFAAELLVEAMDYGQTIIEIDQAVDEMRILLSELDR